MKTDFSGNLIWSKQFPTLYGTSSCVNCVLPELTFSSAGELLIPTGSSTYNWPAFLVSIDTSGVLNWARSLDNSVHEILETSSNTYFMLSNKYPRFGISKADSAGTGNLCSASYQLNVIPASISDSSVTFLSSNLGLTATTDPLLDSAIFVPSMDGCLDIFDFIEEEKNAEIQFYPNPSKSFIFLTSTEDGEARIFIYDLLGKKVYESNVRKDGNNAIIIEHNLHPGIYFMEVEKSGSKHTKKLIVN